MKDVLETLYAVRLIFLLRGEKQTVKRINRNIAAVKKAMA